MQGLPEALGVYHRQPYHPAPCALSQRVTAWGDPSWICQSHLLHSYAGLLLTLSSGNMLITQCTATPTAVFKFSTAVDSRND